jgi:hypothetical protein
VPATFMPPPQVATPSIETSRQLGITVFEVFELNVIALQSAWCRAGVEIPLGQTIVQPSLSSVRASLRPVSPLLATGIGFEGLSPLLLSRFLAMSRHDAEQCRCASRLGVNLAPQPQVRISFRQFVIQSPKRKSPSNGAMMKRGRAETPLKGASLPAA